jgi:hypothetical protein
MRWKYEPKTLYDRIKKRFALLPVVVGEEWVWLESYYSYTEEDYAGPSTIRFNTYREAREWIKKYRYD